MLTAIIVEIMQIFSTENVTVLDLFTLIFTEENWDSVSTLYLRLLII